MVTCQQARTKSAAIPCAVPTPCAMASVRHTKAAYAPSLRPSLVFGSRDPVHASARRDDPTSLRIPSAPCVTTPSLPSSTTSCRTAAYPASTGIGRTGRPCASVVMESRQRGKHGEAERIIVAGWVVVFCRATTLPPPPCGAAPSLPLPLEQPQARAARECCTAASSAASEPCLSTPQWRRLGVRGSKKFGSCRPERAGGLIFVPAKVTAGTPITAGVVFCSYAALLWPRSR
jgi:hypothetical protein